MDSKAEISKGQWVRYFTTWGGTDRKPGMQNLIWCRWSFNDLFIPLTRSLLLRFSSQSQYLGCLFVHSGWPLCLGEKVVVQLSTLDWRLLRSNDFYLQVVPFSTRCPRLALKCLAPGGRTVQEILVPESQHPLVFTTEWLHSVNKERGHKREGKRSPILMLIFSFFQKNDKTRATISSQHTRIKQVFLNFWL